MFTNYKTCVCHLLYFSKRHSSQRKTTVTSSAVELTKVSSLGVFLVLHCIRLSRRFPKALMVL